MSSAQSSRTTYHASRLAPPCHEVPIPRRWISSLLPSATQHDGAEDQPPTAQTGDAEDRSESPQGMSQIDACSFPEHDVQHGFSPEWDDGSVSQGVQQGVKEDQLADDWLAVPGHMIPVPPPAEPVTTMLVRNVDRRKAQEECLRYWPFDIYHYDFFYLLFDVDKNRGSGRIFINFVTQEHAVAFRDQFHGQVNPLLSSLDKKGKMKPLDIEASDRQGLQPNLSHWQHTLRRDADALVLPAVFSEGHRQDFWLYRSS